jgi:hypothetical protein
MGTHHHHDLAWLDNAELVVSELVSDAVKHGGSCLSPDLQAHDEHVTASAADGPAVVTAAVTRWDSDGRPRHTRVIEALSAKRGVRDHERGKRVWVLLRPHP